MDAHDDAVTLLQLRYEIPNFFVALWLGRRQRDLEFTWVTSISLLVAMDWCGNVGATGCMSMPTRDLRRCWVLCRDFEISRLSFGWNWSLRFWIYKRNSHYLLGATLS